MAIPLETALSGLPEVRRLRSSSQAGVTQVTIEFEPDADYYRARQLVTMKAANRSGEIRMARGRNKDVWPIHATFPGEYLAAEHAFADAMQQRFQLSRAQRDQIVRDRYFRDPDTDRLYVFVPSRGLRDKHGGTISAGANSLWPRRAAFASRCAASPSTRGLRRIAPLPASSASTTTPAPITCTGRRLPALFAASIASP